MPEWSDQFWGLSKGLTDQELPSIATIQNNLAVKRLKKRLYNIEQIHFNAQTIVIEGCEHLRGFSGQNWKSRIYSLFYDAGLPRYYILDMYADNMQDTLPAEITIELITYRIKLFVKSCLVEFLLARNKHNVNLWIS